MYTIILSSNKDGLTISFPILLPFIYVCFYCLIALARTSSTMLKRKWEEQNPCFLCVLQDKFSVPTITLLC